MAKIVECIEIDAVVVDEPSEPANYHLALLVNLNDGDKYERDIYGTGSIVRNEIVRVESASA
eukprot:COSAG01_NODE_4928_length_4613_cov_24.277741_3_plen_62_part_00